jgi:hypothetical protein
MLTYENIFNVNFIAMQTAEATNDNGDIVARLYNNNVEINYTIDEINKIVHILYIEAVPQKSGKGTETLKVFLSEFQYYDIIVDALFYLNKWYEAFGFQFEYAIDDMYCYRMKLNKTMRD